MIKVLPAPTETPLSLGGVRRELWGTDDESAIAHLLAELQSELKGRGDSTPLIVSSPRERYYVVATGIARRTPLTGSGWMALALTLGSVAMTGTPAVAPTPFVVRQLSGEVVTVDPITLATVPRSAAYSKFKQVAGWLGVSDLEAARIVGVGRTTPYAWERDAHEPRPSRAGKLYEYHSLLGSVLRSLGPTGLQTWLSSGIPSPRQRLVAGNLAAAYDAAHDLIFSTRYQPTTQLGALQDERRIAPPRVNRPAGADEVTLARRRPRTLTV